MTLSEVHLIHTLWNSCIPSLRLSVKFTHRQLTDGYSPSVETSIKSSVWTSVNVAFRCNYFRTLCEIPMDRWPSVRMSVKVAFRCNYFRTLCEIPTEGWPSVNVAFRCNYVRTLCDIPMDTVRRYLRRWLWDFSVIIFELSVRCRRKAVRRYGRQWMSMYKRCCVCIFYLLSWKKFNDKLCITQNNSNSA